MVAAAIAATTRFTIYMRTSFCLRHCAPMEATQSANARNSELIRSPVPLSLFDLLEHLQGESITSAAFRAMRIAPFFAPGIDASTHASHPAPAARIGERLHGHVGHLVLLAVHLAQLDVLLRIVRVAKRERAARAVDPWSFPSRRSCRCAWKNHPSRRSCRPRAMPHVTTVTSPSFRLR